MEIEEESPSQTSGFCPQDIKSTVSIQVKLTITFKKKATQNTGPDSIIKP